VPTHPGTAFPADPQLDRFAPRLQMGMREGAADQRIDRNDRVVDIEVLRDVAGRMRVHELQPALAAQQHRANCDAPQIAARAGGRASQHETLERAVRERCAQQRKEARSPSLGSGLSLGCGVLTGGSDRCSGLRITAHSSSR
jgi:hypothetical protein